GDEVERISRWATESLLPDVTVLLDMEPRGARMDRALDRVERETAEAAGQIRDAYLALAAREPQRYAVVDAAGEVNEVAARVRAAVQPVVAAIVSDRRVCGRPGPARPGRSRRGRPGARAPIR